MVLVDDHLVCDKLCSFADRAVNFRIVFDVVDPNLDCFAVEPVGTKYPMVQILLKWNWD